MENLNPKSDCLFQMATRGLKAGGNEEELFSGLPLGKHTIRSMMKWISEKARLSRPYTYHCVRATAIQCLVDARVSETAIMGTTGHRQVQSLTSYATRNSDDRRKEMAAVLDSDHRSMATSTVTSRVSTPSEMPQHLDEIDNFIATCDLDQVCANPAVPSCTSVAPRPIAGVGQALQATKAVTFAGATFGDGCSVNLHVHW